MIRKEKASLTHDVSAVPIVSFVGEVDDPGPIDEAEKAA